MRLARTTQLNVSVNPVITLPQRELPPVTAMNRALNFKLGCHRGPVETSKDQQNLAIMVDPDDGVVTTVYFTENCRRRSSRGLS
ncbi:hypothetical protein AAHC03_041 [Spirometra sp. Aus1]